MFSVRWYPYEADNGDTYAVLRDESNTELVSTTADGKSVTSGQVPLPRGWRARYVTVQNADGQQKDCTVLTLAEYAAISTSDAFSGTGNDGTSTGTSWVVVRKTPELQRRQPVNFDSGLNDGDDP